MTVEKTVSEIAEILGVSRQAINNRIKALPEEDLEKNNKGVTVVNRNGLLKLEEIYHKTIIEEEVNEDKEKRELLQILVDEKNNEIDRLYEQLKSKDTQISEKDEQLKVKDVQIAEKDKQLDQQQQLTLAAIQERDRLRLELDEANEKITGKHGDVKDNPVLLELKEEVAEMKAKASEEGTSDDQQDVIKGLQEEIAEMKAKASEEGTSEQHHDTLKELQEQVAEMKAQVEEKKGFFGRLFGR